MADYKEMYLTIMRASEAAISELIQAQQAAEELYLSAPEADIRVLPMAPEDADSNRKTDF